MINYTENQRRSVKYTTSGWLEEVLTAESVEVASSGWDVLAGDNVAEALESADNVFFGFETVTATGIVIITDVTQISGVTGETLENIDVITLPSGEDSLFRFSFSVPAQPTNPVKIQLGIVPRASGVAGNLGLEADINIFENGSDVTPGDFDVALTPVLQSLVAGDFETLKLINFQIPASEFSTVGSAPFLVNCRIKRDVSVGSNYAGNVSVAQVLADNIPGGVVGNIAGYTGGNLLVTGDLTVEGNFVLANSIASPTASGDVGVSGSILVGDNFLYAAVSDNLWKRINLNAF